MFKNLHLARISRASYLFTTIRSSYKQPGYVFVRRRTSIRISDIHKNGNEDLLLINGNLRDIKNDKVTKLKKKKFFKSPLFYTDIKE